MLEIEIQFCGGVRISIPEMSLHFMSVLLELIFHPCCLQMNGKKEFAKVISRLGGLGAESRLVAEKVFQP